jgi:hypothetical protein
MTMTIKDTDFDARRPRVRVRVSDRGSAELIARLVMAGKEVSLSRSRYREFWVEAQERGLIPHGTTLSVSTSVGASDSDRVIFSRSDRIGPADRWVGVDGNEWSINQGILKNEGGVNDGPLLSREEAEVFYEDLAAGMRAEGWIVRGPIFTPPPP